MEEDYWPAVQYAHELDQFSGYLDTAGLKAQAESKGQYQHELSNLSHRLIDAKGSAQHAKHSANSSLEALAQANPDWSETISRVSIDLLAQIDADDNISLLRRRLRYYSAPIMAAFAVAAYLGVVWYNTITIDQPLNTREGLQQRAMAFNKVVEYEDRWSNPFRRNRFLKDSGLDPFQPSESEKKASEEFIRVTLSEYRSLPVQDRKCDFLTTFTDQIGDEEAAMQFLRAVSARLVGAQHGTNASAAEPLDAAVRSLGGCGGS